MPITPEFRLLPHPVGDGILLELDTMVLWLVQPVATDLAHHARSRFVRELVVARPVFIPAIQALPEPVMAIVDWTEATHALLKYPPGGYFT
jgi:hypothetical protein